MCLYATQEEQQNLFVSAINNVQEEKKRNCHDWNAMPQAIREGGGSR